MPSVRSLMLELERNLADACAADDSSEDELDFEPSDELPPEDVIPDIDRSDRHYDPAHDDSLLIEPPGLSESEQFRWHTWRFACKLTGKYIPSPSQIDAELHLINLYGLNDLPPESPAPCRRQPTMSDKLIAIAPNLTEWTSTEDIARRLGNLSRGTCCMLLARLVNCDEPILLRDKRSKTTYWRYRHARS